MPPDPLTAVGTVYTHNQSTSVRLNTLLHLAGQSPDRRSRRVRFHLPNPKPEYLQACSLLISSCTRLYAAPPEPSSSQAATSTSRIPSCTTNPNPPNVCAASAWSRMRVLAGACTCKPGSLGVKISRMSTRLPSTWSRSRTTLQPGSGST